MSSQHDVDVAELASHRREQELEHAEIEWCLPSPAVPTAETPLAPHTAQPPKTSGLFKPELLNQDPSEWAKQFVDSLLSSPEWQAEQAKKLAEKQARRQAREERLTARRQRRLNTPQKSTGRSRV